MQKNFYIDWAVAYLDSYKNSFGLFSPLNKSGQSISYIRWKAPVINKIRLDVDAGFQVHHNLFSAGAIIRDHRGRVVRAKASLLRNT